MTGRCPASTFSGGQSGTRRIALTFDDGPDPYYTPRILDLLAEHEVAATFCVLGTYAAAHPDIISRIAVEGHLLACHSMTHADLSRCGEQQTRWEIMAASRTLQAVAPTARVQYLRTPYGRWNDGARRVAAELGLQPLGWTIDSRDWSAPGVTEIMDALRQQLHPGGIVLLHDGCLPERKRGCSAGHQDQTLAVVPLLIRELRHQGLVPGPPLLEALPRLPAAGTPMGYGW
ncbi:chitooligosaccharide deacetylase NodB [Protofrankia symbiont of Coriaria ruscifolia]|uniref:Polysaccharide deacetylase n=1 Tax=Candidatus Protofrankia californiensis TaxID=1839754 RepID=A0A1C3NZD0_9ACTN|nr:chitooligosaccharide deacetylase NodB [Protofrankia symbiont of Coriaria ruscifolia]SBW22890.1 nodB, polysaccharide deacetylase [Candidatus Protofrankia californiensis]SCV11746.1 polysaccharide deacetylase [Candidatus Protofrankia californiensis]